MHTYLNITEIIISIFLIVMVIAQSRGGGFTGTSQDQTTLFRTRRGVEKTLFQFTLLMAAVFIMVSIASSLVGRA